MLALVVLLVMAALLVVVWRRFGLANCRLRRVVLVAVLGGFLGALALYATLFLRPPALLIMASDALLLFPLLFLTPSPNEVTLAVLAPVLLWVELGAVVFCIMVALRKVSGRVSSQARQRQAQGWRSS